MSQPSYNPHPANQPSSVPSQSGMSGLKIALIILGVIFLLFIILAVVAGFFVSKLFVDSDVMKTVVSDDGRTELQVPSNWNELGAANRNPEASLQYCNLFAETYGLVLTDTRKEVAEALEISEAECNIENFSELMTSALALDGFTSETPEPLTVDGMTCRRVKMRTTLEGTPIVYVVTYCESKKHFHQVHCWTLQSREESNMPTLIKVANSFRELDR